jgi:hypothetical protein
VFLNFHCGVGTGLDCADDFAVHCSICLRVLKHYTIILSYWAIEVRCSAVASYVCSLDVWEPEGLPWDGATENQFSAREERAATENCTWWF